MILIGVVLLLVLTFFIHPYKEGLEEDYLTLAIKSIQSATKDKKMSKDQIIALKDALSYAEYIKYI